VVSATVNIKFPPATLTSISSYQTLDADYIVDISGQFVPLIQALFNRNYQAVGYNNALDVHKFTQEMRFASNDTETWEWIAGGFYTHETTGGNYSLSLIDPTGQSAANDIFGFSGPGTFEEYAGFGDLTYHFNQQFDVTGGIRYAHNNQSQTQISTGLLLGVPPGTVSTIPNRESSDHAFTYLANARYHFTENSTGYIRYATGYRPGGPNTVANDPVTGLPVAPSTFKPDRLSSYEVGMKADTTDRRFGVDLSAYYIKWKDIHILAYVNGIGITANAPGGASVRGAELSLLARVIPDLSITGAFAYQDAKMSAADPNLGASDGERLPNVAKFTASATADYTFSYVPRTPSVGAVVRYVSDRWASFDNSASIPQYRLPAYTLVDLRSGVMLGPVDLQLSLRNVFNKFAEFSADTSRGAAQLSVATPRTVALSASLHY
jgi:iron complex outermembrane receptor protein